VTHSVTVITVRCTTCFSRRRLLWEASHTASSLQCLLDANNTPPSWFRLNDLSRMTSQRIVTPVKCKLPTVPGCERTPMVHVASEKKNFPACACLGIYSLLVFTKDEKRVWRPVKASCIIRSWVPKFPAWHTKAAPNGKCCEGCIVLFEGHRVIY
jgi:hypothetical protein